jgi:hypothetical protein
MRTPKSAIIADAGPRRQQAGGARRCKSSHGALRLIAPQAGTRQASAHRDLSKGDLDLHEP